MKEHLLGKKDRKIFFIKKAMDSYCDALYQEAKCLDIRKKLLSNRALINMWLKNYGKVVEDCINAISIDKSFMSPYVRGSEALVKLEKFDKALQLIERGLKVDAKQKILKELKKEAEEGLKAQQAVLNSKKAKIDAVKTKIMESCSKKGVYLGLESDFKLPEIYSVSLWRLINSVK